MSTKRVVLAEYFTTEELTLLFIVREDFEEPEVIEIPKPLKEIQEFVIDRFREERNEGGQLVKSTSDQIRRLDEAAYQEFFEPFVAPLVKMSDKGDIIWLVPHDVLHYLPLHALKVDGQYLMERNPICYTPSASVMKYCHAKRRERGTANFGEQKALVLGDSLNDLPRAREEALMVAQMFNTTPVLGQQATKSMLTEALEQKRDEIGILHLACHGYFDPYQPLKSGIKLAQSKNGDHSSHEPSWNLTAEEIFGLSMKADLVTLSACESGVNERKPGDELMGLTRSLIYAGTPSVLVTLWRVSDLSTQILMKKFYTLFTAGLMKVEALRQAQIELMAMTAREVIAYCEEAKGHLTGPYATIAGRRLERDIANVRFKARDFKAALADYSRLRQEAESGSAESRELKKALSRCKRALRNPKPADYEMRVYAKPYHWAPFVLVGDWK